MTDPVLRPHLGFHLYVYVCLKEQQDRIFPKKHSNVHVHILVVQMANKVFFSPPYQTLRSVSKHGRYQHTVRLRIKWNRETEPGSFGKRDSHSFQGVTHILTPRTPAPKRTHGLSRGDAASELANKRLGRCIHRAAVILAVLRGCDSIKRLCHVPACGRYMMARRGCRKHRRINLLIAHWLTVTPDSILWGIEHFKSFTNLAAIPVFFFFFKDSHFKWSEPHCNESRPIQYQSWWFIPSQLILPFLYTS